jgi:serine protease Do
MRAFWMMTVLAALPMSRAFTAENTDLLLKRDVESYGKSWIYDDIQRGFDEARASGKPLLVSIRCVP